jgi:hypothetical protein
MNSGSLSYAVVTPVRDEEVNLVRLANCMERQTVRPRVWVIADTGSTDATPSVVAGLAKRLPFVRAISVGGPAVPTRGGPIVRAFMAGIDALYFAPDVVVKQDADTSFGSHYFEHLLAAFATDTTLGLASGLGIEERNGEWRPEYGTRGHVRGPSRAYRWSCLQDVLPLAERRGWDEIDAIKAQLHGWRTGALRDIKFLHHRADGMRDGSSRRRWKQMGGEAHYMGYRFSYLVVRSLWRAREDPLAVMMVAGYVAAVMRREGRYPDTRVRAYLRREQSPLRLRLRLQESLGRTV